MKRLLTVLLAVLMPLLLLAACSTQSDELASPSPVMPTENPTEAVLPTEAPTEAPRPAISCSPVSELNAHDFNAVRSFLEIKDEAGVRNGEKMNEYYDPDDPTTWFFWGSTAHEADGNIPIVEFNENGRLKTFYVPENILTRGDNEYEHSPYNLVGKLDLSGCEELIAVEFSWCGITSLDVTGCNEPNIDITHSELAEVLPQSIESYHISICRSKVKRLHWVTVSEQHEALLFKDWQRKSFDFDLTLEAEGEGYVAIENYGATEGDAVHEGVRISAEWDWDDEKIKFLGWYDKNGKLKTAEASFELSMDEGPGIIEGTFHYIAKFEKAS